jgi:hypothetical protein
MTVYIPITKEDLKVFPVPKEWIFAKSIGHLKPVEQDKLCAIVPYQLCPKCNGQGTVSKPSHVPGDVCQWSSSSPVSQCDVCAGDKIIPMFIVKQKVNF